MDKTEVSKSDNHVKYGLPGLIPLVFAALIAMPLFVHADSEHSHWDKEKHSEYCQKHEQKLHDKLGLTASQESVCKDFIAKIKPEEHKAKQDWSELSKLSTPERLDRMLAKMKDRQQQMESRVKAIKDFYGQLTSEQKKTFDDSFHFHGGWLGWHHHHRHGCDHHQQRHGWYGSHEHEWHSDHEQGEGGR